MGPRKKQPKQGLYKSLTLGEDFRIAVNLRLNHFRKAEDEKEYEFPSSLSADERCYVHRLALELGLRSRSRGKGANRALTVYKREGSTIMASDAALGLAPTSRKLALALLAQFPVTAKERQELVPPGDRERGPPCGATEIRDFSRAMGKLNSGIPQVPPAGAAYHHGAFLRRRDLPIWEHRQEIVQTIANNQVTLITGDTGSGKTTQVPQFILEHFSELRTPCRIVCTEPRRLAAVSVAERTAYERNEKVGQTVGYQIRLESRVSPKTLLTFCTNGVLLRTLMGASSSNSGGDGSGGGLNGALATLTHVIIDEIHERDRFSDFLLTVLRDALNKYRGLKLVLMSATVDVQLFLNYFSGAKHVSVPGRMFPVRELHLEDILLSTGYRSPEMERLRRRCPGGRHLQQQQQQQGQQQTTDMLADITRGLTLGEGQYQPSPPPPMAEEDADVVLEDGFGAVQSTPVDAAARERLDAAVSEAFLRGAGGGGGVGGQEAFDELLRLIFEDNYPINYKHSKTGVTTLMAASCHGNVPVMEQLLLAGADVDARASNKWTARDFAACQGQQAAVELLESYKESLGQSAPLSVGYSDNVPVGADGDRELTEEQRELLALYHGSFDDDRVDHRLIVHLVECIHLEAAAAEETPPTSPVAANGAAANGGAPSKGGAILVFLPGYDDIVTLRDMLYERPGLLVLTLHSQMGSIDQKRMFKPAPPGMRKVILSTNIAETSVTIDDVTFVIDSGKVKEKSYDALTGVSMLKTSWVSKASATQRKGRAGRVRPGAVYRCYSRACFLHFCDSQQPEIMRTPLVELCLHTKLLAPPNTPIADFLSRTPQPPAFLVTRNAVQALKTMEALDAWEDVTELGNHLLDLPIEPRLGKMVLYAVVLKCLDPVLTIVCCIAYRDPYLVPTLPNLKRLSKHSKRKFSAGSYSDHMTLLRAFQGWQKSRVEGVERSFCHQNQISGSTMEMVTGMRTQLLGQLRASGFVRAKGAGDIRDINKNSENWAVVKAALAAGSYPNLARFDREARQLRTARESKVRLHPSSILLETAAEGGGGANGRSMAAGAAGVAATNAQRNRSCVGQIPTDWFIFDEMTRAGHLAMIRGVTAVSPVAVLIFAGPNRLPAEAVSEADAGAQGGNPYLEEGSDSEVEERTGEGEDATLRIDDWAVFRADAELAHLALQLRQKWSSLFLRRLHAPGKPMSQMDNNVIDILVNILSTEEQNMGLTQPIGIGQRPKPISTDTLCSSPGLDEQVRMMPGDDLSGRRGSGGGGGGGFAPFGPVVTQGGSGGGPRQPHLPQFCQRNPYR